MPEKKFSRLEQIMSRLNISALEISKRCEVSSSLISRWRKGDRPFPKKGPAGLSLCAALLSADADGVLDEFIAPFLFETDSREEALCLYLSGDELPAMPARMQPLPLQEAGEYVTSQQVLLGKRGFRKAGLLLLDYMTQLPPGLPLQLCAHNGFDLLLKNVPFALRFLQKLSRTVKRGATFQLISRRGYGMEEASHFAGFWLVAHLKGILRSRYHDQPAPEELFVAVVPGYFSARAETDEDAEDGMITTIFTDARNIRKDEVHCAKYIECSAPASQYGFLQNPLGDENNPKGWDPGPLPRWNTLDAKEPDGSFGAIYRVPSFGVLTDEEFAQMPGAKNAPPVPEYLFSRAPRYSHESNFAHGSHRIILCREDVREALTKARRLNEPLTMLLGRKTYIPKNTLIMQLRRILAAMAENKHFEVALVPRSAFAKLELEIICWKNSAAVGWLQDESESVFANDPITSGTFEAAIRHTWDKLQKGWKHQDKVARQLRKWIAGKELTTKLKDSATVRNWDVLPKE